MDGVRCLTLATAEMIRAHPDTKREGGRGMRKRNIKILTEKETRSVMAKAHDNREISLQRISMPYLQPPLCVESRWSLPVKYFVTYVCRYLRRSRILERRLCTHPLARV